MRKLYDYIIVCPLCADAARLFYTDEPDDYVCVYDGVMGTGRQCEWPAHQGDSLES